MSQPQIYYLIRYVKHISHTEWRRRIKSSLLVCEKPKPKLSNWHWNKGKPLHTTIPSKPNKLFWDSKHSHVQPAPSAELKILFFFFTLHQTAHIHTLNYTLSSVFSFGRKLRLTPPRVGFWLLSNNCSAPLHSNSTLQGDREDVLFTGDLTISCCLVKMIVWLPVFRVRFSKDTISIHIRSP